MKVIVQKPCCKFLDEEGEPIYPNVGDEISLDGDVAAIEIQNGTVTTEDGLRKKMENAGKKKTPVKL